MKPTPSQGRRLIALLKRKPMTYGEMHRTGISTCPHKRVAECLAPHELLVKATNAQGLVVLRVRTATKWTA